MNLTSAIETRLLIDFLCVRFARPFVAPHGVRSAFGRHLHWKLTEQAPQLLELIAV